MSGRGLKATLTITKTKMPLTDGSTAPVYIHGIEVGQIGVMDSRHSFTDVDFEIVDFLCKIVSLELQESDFTGTNPGAYAQLSALGSLRQRSS